MVDPYKAGLFKENPYASKRIIKGKSTVILRGKLEERGLELIQIISRAMLKDEIHELIVTDEENIEPGSKVNKIAYIGFVEITAGGVMIVGDTLTYGDKVLGRVIRFDGVEQGLRLESDIMCK